MSVAPFATRPAARVDGLQRPGGAAPREIQGAAHLEQDQKAKSLGREAPAGARPRISGCSVDIPEIAIVTAAEWEAAHAAIAADREQVWAEVGEATPGNGAKYLLTGMLKCRCGAGIEARTRQQGGRRVLFYGCSAYQRKGSDGLRQPHHDPG